MSDKSKKSIKSDNFSFFCGKICQGVWNHQKQGGGVGYGKLAFEV